MDLFAIWFDAYSKPAMSMTGSPGLTSGFQLSSEVVNPSANLRQKPLKVPLETTPLAIVEQAEIWVDSRVTTT